ncbi:RNA polymerase sigma24 factor [Sphaerisporangium rufum]|uniref:RNA polymerase sigma24 factor n=1 Tax=Sphaerisporangium rufum TaxID=1381558 RepID=A0A919V2T9_9ACTN|nr:RNA polymerase sigma factor SigJ [Sphaerisporangium rufum]GII81059.1 RNA polymerase sigma24 factor [Sphaerisporangium rufum]
MSREESVALFEEQRRVLTAVAYRVLGSVADAEDVVQEAWLRWSAVDAAAVRDPRAFLVRVTTRLAIDRLRSVKARREAYVGPWLPEPLGGGPGVADHAELAGSVDLALMVVLETLTPLERAVFVLREAFGMSYAEIGEVVGRGEQATRQLGHRARDHVRERRPRFDVDRRRHREVTERFLGACVEGDLAALMELLARDVTLIGDGGGRAKAPLRVIESAGKVARFLLGIASPANARRFLASAGLPEDIELRVTLSEVNGAPAVLAAVGGRPAMMITLDVTDGLVRTVYLLVNPDKMSRLALPDPSESA